MSKPAITAAVNASAGEAAFNTGKAAGPSDDAPATFTIQTTWAVKRQLRDRAKQEGLSTTALVSALFHRALGETDDAVND